MGRAVHEDTHARELEARRPLLILTLTPPLTLTLTLQAPVLFRVPILRWILLAYAAQAYPQPLA